MFKFNVTKAVQAVGAIFREEDSTVLEYLRVIKLLYLAERESIKEIGRPIIGDTVVAMDHGPALSRVYDLIKGSTTVPEEMLKWSAFVERCGRYVIRLSSNPGVGQLSRYETKKLRDVTKRNIGKDQWEIVDDMHKLEEWKKHYLESTSRHIPLKTIFEAVGRADKFEGAMRAAKEEAIFDEFFPSARQ